MTTNYYRPKNCWKQPHMEYTESRSETVEHNIYRDMDIGQIKSPSLQSKRLSPEHISNVQREMPERTNDIVLKTEITQNMEYYHNEVDETTLWHSKTIYSQV
ncbi:hypothetical protein [Circovirus-like genome DCCV-3]|uniref:hypothetical protein n=1 Tax=Circovirus-like genome DCCV-3 TaxID=1788443 RepID=UPI0007F9A3A6|nr:hypothetical protein [Circovirus-like genome DCCV-3]AMB42957.1 hypothetical protein [Circovirus-like genome DCCV-3]